MEQYIVQNEDEDYFYVRYEFPDYFSGAQWNLYTLSGVLVSSLTNVDFSGSNQVPDHLVVTFPSDDVFFFEVLSGASTSTMDDLNYLQELGVALIVSKIKKLHLATQSRRCRGSANKPSWQVDFF